jgi:hypothetical protein
MTDKKLSQTGASLTASFNLSGLISAEAAALMLQQVANTKKRVQRGMMEKSF